MRERTPVPESEVRARFERFQRWTIEVEYPAREQFLSGPVLDAFADYYRKLPAPGDEAAIRHWLQGTWRADSGWVSRWLGRRPNPAVLDAGSGFGTFAMLYAAVGADVTAVDLRPDRLEGAERRLEFYRRSTGEALRVHNQRADLTREWDREYDLVWVYNALSHIDPLDPFLAATRKHLKPGGVLVVGDINGAHPGHLARLAKLRQEVHQEYVAPDGQRHTYAVERTFPPEEMREVMIRNGLRVVHHELYWRGMAALPDLLYGGILRPLQTRWTLGRRIARRQLIVATRDREDQ
ncbi:MAG TPA: methyltransferase [Candidatus Eisenbacteria bacterium]|nr:methyltransferase [Candidatus Eisenbacteria bacterium]